MARYRITMGLWRSSSRVWATYTTLAATPRKACGSTTLKVAHRVKLWRYAPSVMIAIYTSGMSLTGTFLNTQAARFLAERSFAPLTYAEFDHNSIKALLESLYSEGALRAECTILRCVGFNHYIHDSLSSKYDGAKVLQDRITHYKRQEGPVHKRKRFDRT